MKIPPSTGDETVIVEGWLPEVTRTPAVVVAEAVSVTRRTALYEPAGYVCVTERPVASTTPSPSKSQEYVSVAVCPGSGS